MLLKRTCKHFASRNAPQFAKVVCSTLNNYSGRVGKHQTDQVPEDVPSVQPEEDVFPSVSENDLDLASTKKQSRKTKSVAQPEASTPISNK